MKTVYSEEDIKNSPRREVLYMACPDEYRWLLAKPENAKSLFWRLKASWQVFKGRAVPVEWF